MISEIECEYIVTIDGPANSGKTTLGQLVSYELGFEFIETGLFSEQLLVYIIPTIPIQTIL